MLVGTFIKQCIVEINNIFLPGAKEEEERKEKELLKTRVRELEEEVVKNWVIPLKMLILRLLEIGNNSGVDRTKGFDHLYYCQWKPKVEKLRGRAKKLAEMLEVVRSQVFS